MTNNIGLKEGLEAIQQAIVSLAKVPYFEQKHDIMNILLDLEWKLKHDPTMKPVNDSIPDELTNNREEPWGD